MIRKILIANRGEIAMRVMQSCREMGVETVAVFSEVDRTSQHVMYADEAYCIGESVAADSYLNIDKVIEVAKQSNADAVHPGYGFLSENPAFAERCEREGLIFIGPRAETIRTMGDKMMARRTMLEAGIPVVPGTEKNIASPEEAEELCNEIGYPVILKSAMGGGGKGMRIVRSSSEVKEAFIVSRNEAVASFGDSQIYVEKFIEEPHHIEIQILGDNYGNIVHLYDRECSVQRRNQKIVEESPSPFISSELRKTMGQKAVEAATFVGYRGAGTIEFLVDKNHNFYFLEMNTRLQVEHPVTEEVVGLDLVKEQIRVAEGQTLALKQDDIRQRGHAIECRICAEDADFDFMPSSGTVKQLYEPRGIGVRIDTHIYEGYEVPMDYDSMLGKLIVWGDSRKTAIARMQRALGELRLTGITTNIPYLRSVLAHEVFMGGNYNTAFVEVHHDELVGRMKETSLEEEEVAAILAFLDHSMQEESKTTQHSLPTTTGWRNFGRKRSVLRL